MQVPKQDIRITKTHKALAEALMALSEKKSFQKITVNDICQTAMVSRSTFYLHFEDKYQLLLFCLQVERERLEALAKSYEDPRETFHTFFQAIQDRKRVYFNLFRADIDIELSRMLHNFFHGVFVEIINRNRKRGMEINGPVSLMAAYQASGIAGMIVQWIEEDFRYSVDEISLCLYEIISDYIPE